MEIGHCKQTPERESYDSDLCGIWINMIQVKYLSFTNMHKNFTLKFLVVLIYSIFFLTNCYSPLAQYRFGRWVEKNYPDEYKILGTVSDWNEGTMDTESYSVTFQNKLDSDLIFTLSWRTDREDGGMTREKFDSSLKQARFSLDLTRFISKTWKGIYPKSRVNASIHGEQISVNDISSLEELWRKKNIHVRVVIYQYTNLDSMRWKSDSEKISSLLTEITKKIPIEFLNPEINFFSENLFPESENPLMHPYYISLATTSYVSENEEYSLPFRELPKKIDSSSVLHSIEINSLFPPSAIKAEIAMNTSISKMNLLQNGEKFSFFTPYSIYILNGNLDH